MILAQVRLNLPPTTHWEWPLAPGRFVALIFEGGRPTAADMDTIAEYLALTRQALAEPEDVAPGEPS